MIFHDTARIQSSKPSLLNTSLISAVPGPLFFTFAFTVYGSEKDYFEGKI